MTTKEFNILLSKILDSRFIPFIDGFLSLDIVIKKSAIVTKFGNNPRIVTYYN